MADREKAIKELKWLRDQESWKEGLMTYDDHAETRKRICGNAVELLENSVSKLYADQLKWERDVALRQLSEIGKSFGERMDDIVALQTLNGRGNVNG